ncbi:putative polyketide synthase [Rhypophila sp. PSN 637]
MYSGKIAIVGMACRLPGGASCPESLWSMLAEGRNGQKEVPASRWDWRSFYHKAPDAKEATNFSKGYFLNEDVSEFDARFFGVPVAEASGIDPQQRMLLEVTYEALENAGIPLEKMRGSPTSVHIAMFAKDYDKIGYKDGPMLHKSHILGSGDAILANRLSYLLDLRGPSNVLDTGCSGSLLALHQACLTLRAGESTVAIAGASQLLLSPDQSAAMSTLTNPDGTCYTFDSRGAGYGRGEGLGVLVLKRLEKAIADGDQIQAVIVETGSNHDGKTAGIFLPNPDAQEALARAVYKRASLDPLDTLYVEAHGTGTQAGDAAEIGSISKVFGRPAGRNGELVVGAIKSNIGHLEASSGVASLIKAVMVLKKNMIPPQLNFISPKPTLHLEERGIKIPLELTRLTLPGYTGPRRVSVNSFGYGGTNAHAILEAYDEPVAENGHTDGLNGTNGHTNGINEKLITLSANTEHSLTSTISNLLTWLQTETSKPTSQQAPFNNIAHTLNNRRSRLPYRTSLIASSTSSLLALLSDSAKQHLRPTQSSKSAVSVGYIFTGQGAQWFAMGRELLSSSSSSPEFLATIQTCNSVMKSLGCEWDLVEELVRDRNSSRVGESRFSQPLTTAVQIGLVDLLEARYGIRPGAVCGHSSGEIAAAYACGAITREVAMRVSYMRGICSAQAKGLNTTRGAMLAVGEGEDKILQRIDQLDRSLGRVVVACVNSPESTTISGDEGAIHALAGVLEQAGVFNRLLKVDSAYHSHHMEVVSEAYINSLEGIVTGRAREDVAFFSSVTGARKVDDFGPGYWNSNSVGQVKFAAASELVARHLAGDDSKANKMVIVEVGPHSALMGPLRQCLGGFKYDYLSALVRNESAVRTVLAVVGKLFEVGYPVGLEADTKGARLVDNLPTYAWDHSAGGYWHESRLSKGYRFRPFPPHDLAGLYDVGSSPYEPRWRHVVSLETLPWLRDHVIEGFVIFPGAGYIAYVIEAMKQLFKIRNSPGRLRSINFRNVSFAKPVVIYDDPGAQGSREVELQLVITPSRQYAGSKWEHFRVLSYDGNTESWIDNCHGETSWEAEVDNTSKDVVSAEDLGLGHLTKSAAAAFLPSTQSVTTNFLDAVKEYQDLRKSGNEYGPTFQLLEDIHLGRCTGTAKVVTKDIAELMPGQYQQPHTIHPSTFDSVLHLEGIVFHRECSVVPIMPVRFGECSIAVDGPDFSTPGAELVVALELLPETKREAGANFCVYHKLDDGTYRPVLTGKDVKIQAIGDATNGDADAAKKKMSYRMEWKADVDFLSHASAAKDVGLAQYMDALVHKNPFCRLLSVGGGDGGRAVAKFLEEAERAQGCSLVDGFTLTSPTAESLETAKADLGEWAGNAAHVEFKTLEVERDPLAQGFTAASFDVAVVAASSSGVDGAALANLRKLLKVGGRLVVLVDQDGEVTELDEALKTNGFNGADLVLAGLVVSRAVEGGHVAASQANGSATLHLSHPSDEAQLTFASVLAESLRRKGIESALELDAWSTTDPEAYSDNNNNNNKIDIVIDSAEHPILVDFESSESKFEQVKQLLLQGKKVFWVTFQGSASSNPVLAAIKNMATGLARVARRENPYLRLITVDVQDEIRPCVIQALTKVALCSFFEFHDALRSEEFEYMMHSGGQLFIPRVVPDDQFSRFAESRGSDSSRNGSLVETKYLDKDRPLMFSVQVPGLLNSIRFVDNEDMTNKPLGAQEVQVEARAHGVNFKDVFISLGQLPANTVMTGEMAGVVTAVGSKVTKWKAGDRVVGVFVSPYGNQVRIDERGVVGIPDNISFADAAAIPITYYTAWYCLSHVARFEQGQSVLIHAASGGVGQAAIQMAQLLGAGAIYCTVGSAAKKKAIMDLYGIPEKHIFSSHSGQFKKHILNLTGGEGVDVVLNSLSGQLLRDSWDCLAQFGTFCEIGKADIISRSQLNMANFEKQATFAAVDMSHMYKKKPGVVAKGLADIFSLVSKGQLKTANPVTTLPMSSLEEAFRMIVARKHIGKMVLLADEDTVVQATRPKPLPLKLYRDGTYVIGGGLGDLGKKMAVFLAKKGAGHIVALTRRNLDTDKRKEYQPLEESISKLCGKLHILQCDISSLESSQAAAHEILATLPPIRGLIQSALVLRDHPLEFMDLDDWTTSVNPKVKGTINMHKAFCSPETTDFFVMLSSISSIIGNATQGNYAAGNAFQDAFAHAANSSSTRGITSYIAINAGAVEGSGLINNLKDLSHGRDIASTVGSVTFDEVLATLEYAMGENAKAAQLIMHFDRDAMEEAMGTAALAEHLFDHIPSQKRHASSKTGAGGGGSGNKKASVTQLVEQAASIAEAEEVVRGALLDKFAAFVGDHVYGEDQPIAALGLDSLVSIELKNWVKHTFTTPLQVSELSGAKGILPLAKLIVSRMPHLKGKGNGDVAERKPLEDKKVVVSKPNGSREKLSCCKLQNGHIPAQPLPDLDDVLDFWLDSNAHLYSPSRLETIQQDISALRAPDSPARGILASLYKKHAHLDPTNKWFSHLVTEGRFLSSRGPIAPFASIMASHSSGTARHTQSERAAIIVRSALEYQTAFAAGEVEPLELVPGRPECTWRAGWLFNSVRVPQVGCDKMVSYAEEYTTTKQQQQHIAVLRRGHLFKVPVSNELSHSALEQTFASIISSSDTTASEEIYSGILTTDNRDSWAVTRESLTALSPSNASFFSVIDTAMFVLCLDSGSPVTPQEIARQGYIGDGSNRWFDKVLQFYVSSNGLSGQITEHAIVDGNTPARLVEFVVRGIASYTASPPKSSEVSSAAAVYEAIPALETTPAIENQIALLRNKFVDLTSRSTYVRETLPELGIEYLMKSGAPVKGVIDLTWQLAVRLFFGPDKAKSSWEPMSLGHFHAGRSDALQRGTPAVIKFCDAAATTLANQSDKLSPEQKEELRALLSQATKSLSSEMANMLNTGRSYLRTFEVLSYLWPKDRVAEKPRFLSEMTFFGRGDFAPIWSQTNAFDLEGRDSPLDDFVHLVADTDGFWSILAPEKEGVRVSLTGGERKRTEAFVRELHRAAGLMRGIVGA